MTRADKKRLKLSRGAAERAEKKERRRVRGIANGYVLMSRLEADVFYYEDGQWKGAKIS